MSKELVSYENLLSQRERDLEDKNEELEAQHEELTAAVEALIQKNNYLEKTLEELNMLNSEIDQIVYRSSHDLKSPISSMEGLLTLMSVDKNNIDEYLTEARKSTGKMNHILLMLVRYSNSLVSEVIYEEVDLEKIWTEVLEELSLIEGFNDTKITLQKNVSHYTVDRERTKLILYNLIKNGIDFRSNKKARVDVKLFVKQDNFRIQVSDNGIGIESKFQEDVFKMFFRGTNVSKGSGLGLYLCQRATSILGGKTNLISAENVGTTINIELPNKKRP